MIEDELQMDLIPQDSLWLRGIFRPLLIVVLVTCLAAGFVAVVQSVAPGWGRGIVLPFVALVAGASTYTTLWLASPARRFRRTSRFRAGELFLVLVLARLIAFVVAGEWPTPAMIVGWVRDPFSFLNPTVVFVGFLTLLAWGESMVMTGLLEEMALKPDELVTNATAGYAFDWNEIRARHPSRVQLAQQFNAHWLWGGLLLAFCAGLSRVELLPSAGQLFGISHLGISSLLQIALVAYFVGGLLLLSQGRLAVLRARWQYEGTPADPDVIRRWGRIGIAILVIMALVAALLPFGSSFALAQILMVMINFGMQVAYLILVLIMGLLGAVMSLLGVRGGDTQPPPAQQAPPLIEAVAKRPPLPDWIGGALLWTIMLAIVVYSLFAYLGGRGVRIDWSKLRHWWQLFLQWFGVWRGRAQAVGRRLRDAILAGRAPSDSDGQPLWRFLNVRRLDPRGQIRYFYLSTAHRAADQGVPRQPAETPNEYEEDLATSWPELDRDLASLTDSFVHARYSAHELRPEDARSVQEIWRRIKASLRAKAKAARDAAEADKDSSHI